MITKRKLKEEIIKLNYRIAELEERLCPCDDHDWKLVDSYTITYNGWEFDDTYKYKCRRCGKIKQTRYKNDNL